MFVAFGLILLEWGTVIFATQNKIYRISCYVVVMILPFVLTGVPHKLIDKTYYGTVTTVDGVTALSCNSAVKVGGDMMWYTKNTIFLTLLLENGKSIRAHRYITKRQRTFRTGTPIHRALFSNRTDMSRALPPDAYGHLREATAALLSSAQNMRQLSETAHSVFS